MNAAPQIRRTIAWICLFLPSAAGAGERDLLELRTPTFTVYSVASEKTTRHFVANVLAFERVAGGMSGTDARRAAGPSFIYLVSNDDWARYFQTRPGVVGVFSDTSGLGNDLVVPTSGSMADAYPSVFHEYMHFIIRTQFPGYCPPWFDEGIAELLSTARFRAEKVKFPAPADRLRDLAGLPWIPADTFFKVTRNSEEYQRHRLAASFYAQSWLTMHYAFIGNPGFLRQLLDYIVRINAGAPDDEAAVAAFGSGGFEGLDHRLRTYAKNPSFRDAAIDVAPDKTLPSAPVRRLDRTESLLALGQLALRMRVAPERSEPLFAAILADSPNDTRALAALAYLSAVRDDYPRAREYLAKLEAAPVAPLSADAATWAGDAQLRLAQPPQSDEQGATRLETAQLRLAHGLYRRALAADAHHLGAVHGLARVCTFLDECVDEAVAPLTAAQARAPASWRLAYDMAWLQTRRGDREAALQQWRLLAKVAKEPELRQLARERLGLASEGESPKVDNASSR